MTNYRPRFKHYNPRRNIRIPRTNRLQCFSFVYISRNKESRSTVETGQESNIIESLTLRIEWSTRVHWFFTPWNHPDPLRPPSRKKRDERIYLAGDAAGVAFRSNCAKWAPRVSPAGDGLTNQAENWILGAPVALCSPLSRGCGWADGCIRATHSRIGANGCEWAPLYDCFSPPRGTLTLLSFRHSLLSAIK